jgi:DNA-binding NarL/FixJ family response regulator
MPANFAQPPASASLSRPVRITLVEDQPEIRENWTRLINSFPDFVCMQSCVSAEEALRAIPANPPDVVLMDIFLPRMSGIECVKKLKALLPELQIVMLTAVDDDELVFLALESGADGFLLKLTRPDDLRSSLLDVLKGGVPMTSQIARRVIGYFRQKNRAHDDSVRLSAREEEVLVLLTRGYSNKEIAEHLSLSIDTVSTYLKSVYKKMHVRSRAEAVARYLSNPREGRGSKTTEF